MKHLLNSLALLLLTLMIFSCDKDDDPVQEMWEVEVEQVSAATEQYINFQTALDDGLFDVSGYVENMGHHYLNPGLVDGTFELEKPEIILYVPNDNGDMEMVAVEYAIVPDDPNNPGEAPEGFTGDEDVWHFNEMVGQWQLHVWTILPNPDGIFAAFNPDIGD
ncbi:MAG: hypothetical protein AAFP77_31140 [Bacteroidota bacterium]